MTTLAQHLVDTAADAGDRPALRMDDTVLTHARFRAAVALEPGASAEAGELEARVEERVAAHEYPRHPRLVGSARRQHEARWS